MKIFLRRCKFFYCASFVLIGGLAAQTITVTPAEPYVGVGATQQFHAAVTGLSSSTVTWSLLGMAPVNNPKLGTISTTGLYTAPATAPAQNPVTVQATGSDGKTTGIAYVLIEPLGPTLTSVSPNPVNVGSYTVTITGQGFVKGAYVNAGGISLEVTYVSSTQLTAVGYVGSAGTLPFTVSNPGTLPSNTINVPFVTPLTVSPASANVALGASKTFSVSGGQTVTWSATAGSITSGGVFTAPATMPSSSAVIITATGSGGQTGTAKVTLTQPETPVSAPTFNPGTGSYTAAQTVTISSATTGASIRYTTDGSNPSATAGTLYSAGVSVGVTTTVKAIAYKSGMTNSAVSSAAYTINLPAVTISVSPTTANLSAGQTQGITATVTNSTNTGVTWTINPATGAGTLSATTSTSGTSITYTAPASIATTTTVTVTATSAADGTKSAISTITLNPAVSILVSPTTASLSAGQTQGITATVTNSANTGVTWTINPATGAGTISATTSTSGTSITYTAPASITTATTVTVTATSSADGTKSAVSTITLNPAVSILVSPTAASLAAGQTQGVTATVMNSTNLGVTFTINPATGAGTLSATTSTSGIPITYTAPASIASKTTVTITATSAGDNTKSAVSTITLNPTVVTGGPITVSPPTVSVALNGSQTFIASGQSSVSWTASAGSITSLGVFTAPSSMTSTGTVTITAAGSNNQSGTATVTLTGGTTLVPAATAQRFLQQAAFGPSSSDIANVQAVGLQGWLNQQFAMGKISNYSNLSASMSTRFLTNSVMNADQLRQRVGFALSQITVVSLNTLIFPTNVTPFQDMLLTDAFTNYRQILGDVTLSAAMGGFLNMVNNAAANPALGTVANENYARELMQLFSIGTVKLNQDGSVQLGSDGLPAPTYNQANVTELARVLTGWTFAQSGVAPYWGAGINDGNTDVTSPMVAIAQFHDTGSKTLLPDYLNGNGTAPYVAPAGLAQAADLSAALDNIFYNPNVGPFIGKQLIQHLVKSNPSPQYISRVAAAFANNGHGVRGDMQAIITAVLLDPEARANDAGGNDQSTDGHMQEPALFLAGMIRAFNGTVNDQNYFQYDLLNMDQDIFNAGSVFNYYSPNYVVPAAYITPQPATGPTGGEFQIFDTYTSIYRANLVVNLFGSFSSPLINYGPGTAIDLTSYQALAKTPSALVNAMDQTLTRGLLPAAVKSIITTAVAAEDPAGYTNGMKQVETALYLIATSNYYNVWH